LGYTAQILISRKISTNLSLELAPTFFNDNYVAINDQDNSQFALGLGGRYKLGKRWSLNMDYGWHLNRTSDSPFKNPF
jgi:predicted porin